MASHVPLRKRFLQLLKPWLPGAFRPSVLAVDGPSVQRKRGAVSGDLQSTELPIESTRGVFRQEPQELPCSSGACHRVQRRRLIQEIGSEKALKHFQAGLSQKGLHYPHHILARLSDASITWGC